MKKHTYLLIIPIVVSLMVSCGSPEEQTTTALDPVNVKVGTAVTTDVTATVAVSGKIEASSSANISTRMMGAVTSVMVKPGDQVNKGDLLLTISSADLIAKKAQVEAAIAQAKSGYENAEKDYERFKSLYEKGSASKKELENITTHYQIAKSGLAAAQEMEKEVNAQFTYTNLRAPFSGIVANVFVKIGDMASPGYPLATIEGTGIYEAAVMVPESQIANILLGAKADVMVKSSDQTIQGIVSEVSPSAKNTGGQFLVKLSLDSHEGILPGMFVKAEISITDQPNYKSSPMVAKNALIRNGQLSGIYTISGSNTAILRWIRTGNSHGENIEVLSGISTGEKYIVSSEGKLFNGATVVFN